MKTELRNILLLTGLVLLLAITNFAPNTFLTGWDNLHPEFDFPLSIQRSLFSAWQEYQGLGLSGGLGHAAELPRQIILWFFSFVFPMQSLRYIYHFSTILFGTVGTYLLLKKVLLKNAQNNGIASLLGAVIYLCNLATLQMFYVPFEPFSHHFASLPWIFMTNIMYLYRPTRRNLLFLILASVMAIPQGFVATYFLVTSMLLGIIFIIAALQTKTVRYAFICGLVLIFTNAFWLFPNVYFLVFKSSVTVNAKINEIATEDNFLKNKKYGDLQNSVILKNFWFENVETNPNGTTSYQMQEWIPHFNKPVIAGIGYSIFLVIVTGIAAAIWKKQKPLLFLPLFILSFTLLANDIPGINYLANLFYKIPLFSQIFRFPFTKFAIMTSLCFAVFYAQAATVLIRDKKHIFAKTAIIILLFSLPLIFMYPIFFGKFFQDKNKLVIPKEYFDTFAFFKSQEKTARIANFPQYTYWGWSLYRWGYRGSGILWYGIEQPIVDRAFDVWGKENENYYHEMSYAVYSGNQPLFESLLEKYDISWIIIDDSVISFSSQKPIYFNKLREIVGISTKLAKEKTFGTIHIYKVKKENERKSYVSLFENLPVVTPSYEWNNYDKAFTQYGNYVTKTETTTNQQEEAYYPFRSLFTNKNQALREFRVTENKDYLAFTASIPLSFAGGKLILPLTPEEYGISQKKDSPAFGSPEIYLDNELIPYIPLNTTADGLSSVSGQIEIPLPYIKKGALEIRVPKISGNYSFDSNDISLSSITPIACNPFSRGKHSFSITTEDKKSYLELVSLDSSNCVDFDLPNLLHRFGYIISVDALYKEGRSLLFLVRNKNSQREEIEVYLPKTKGKSTSYFVIPPMEHFTAGYALHFDNIATGRVKSVNSLGRTRIQPIPYELLTSIRAEKPSVQTAESMNVTQNILNVLHPNPSVYVIEFLNKPKENQTLSLAQGYDRGWFAYSFDKNLSKIDILFPFIRGKNIPNHLLINNWQNGWMLPKETLEQPASPPGGFSNRTIIIVFLPQYLQYIGAVLFITPFILLFVLHKKRH